MSGAQQTKRNKLRLALIAVAAVVVVIVAGVAIAVASFDPNSQKPRIIEAVRQATGRELKLNGPVALKVSLWPTLAVRDVALANPPGFSRPDMARLSELDVQLALLPLIRGQIEIVRLTLVKPDIKLETDAQGHPNWVFAPQPGATPAPVAPQQTHPQSAPMPVAVQDIAMSDGVIAYRDDRTKRDITLAIATLSAHATSADAPLHLTAKANYNTVAFNLTVDTGPLMRLQQPENSNPWPLHVVLESAPLTLAVEGAVTQPLAGKGYNVSVSMTVPDTAAVAALWPGMALPSGKNIRLKARAVDNGQALPDISEIALHTGAIDLAAYAPGITIEQADITAAASDKPVQLSVDLRKGDAHVALAGTVGPLGALMARATQPATIDLTAKAAGASLAVKGQVAAMRTASGVALHIDADVPDLAALSPLAGSSLPPVKSLKAKAAVSDANSGLQHRFVIKGLTVSAPGSDLAGEASVQPGQPMSLTATLTSQTIDATPWMGAQPASPPSNGPAPKGPAAAEAARSKRLFSDRPLPFGQLQMVNADVRARIGELRMQDATYKAIDVHLNLQDGHLKIDPLTAVAPEGQVSGTLSVDATEKAPPVGMTLRAPGLALRPLLAALRQPPYAAGRLEVYADLRGAGESPNAIAASLSGHLGLALANGTVDNRLLGNLLNGVLQNVKLPDIVGRNGSSDLRCFALRLDFQRGIGTARALELSSSLLTMSGTGSVNLGNETLALRLLPEGRVGGNSIVVPVKVTGPIAAPTTAVDSVGTAEANAGTIAGAAIGSATPLGVLGGMLGADKLLGGGGGDACAGPLALARGGEAPASAPAAAGSSAPSQGSRPKPPNPADLLKNLFR